MQCVEMLRGHRVTSLGTPAQHHSCLLRQPARSGHHEGLRRSQLVQGASNTSVISRTDSSNRNADVSTSYANQADGMLVAKLSAGLQVPREHVSLLLMHSPHLSQMPYDNAKQQIQRLATAWRVPASKAVEALAKRPQLLSIEPRELALRISRIGAELGLNEQGLADSSANLSEVLRCAPDLLLQPASVIRERMARLGGIFGGMPSPLVRKVCRKHPLLLVLPDAKLQAVLAYLTHDTGLTREEVSQLCRSQPSVLTLSVECLQGKMQALKSVFGLDPWVVHTKTASQPARVPAVSKQRQHDHRATGAERPPTSAGTIASTAVPAEPGWSAPSCKAERQLKGEALREQQATIPESAAFASKLAVCHGQQGAKQLEAAAASQAAFCQGTAASLLSTPAAAVSGPDAAAAHAAVQPNKSSQASTLPGLGAGHCASSHTRIADSDVGNFVETASAGDGDSFGANALLRRIVLAQPALLSYSAAALSSRAQQLQALFPHPATLRSALQRAPGMLLRGVTTYKGAAVKAVRLAEILGCDKAAAEALLVRRPALLLKSSKALRRSFDALSIWHMSLEERMSLITAHPALLTLSPPEVHGRCRWLRNLMTSHPYYHKALRGMPKPVLALLVLHLPMAWSRIEWLVDRKLHGEVSIGEVLEMSSAAWASRWPTYAERLRDKQKCMGASLPWHAMGVVPGVIHRRPSQHPTGAAGIAAGAGAAAAAGVAAGQWGFTSHAASTSTSTTSSGTGSQMVQRGDVPQPKAAASLPAKLLLQRPSRPQEGAEAASGSGGVGVDVGGAAGVVGACPGQQDAQKGADTVGVSSCSSVAATAAVLTGPGKVSNRLKKGSGQQQQQKQKQRALTGAQQQQQLRPRQQLAMHTLHPAGQPATTAATERAQHGQQLPAASHRPLRPQVLADSSDEGHSHSHASEAMQPAPEHDEHAALLLQLQHLDHLARQGTSHPFRSSAEDRESPEDVQFQELYAKELNSHPSLQLASTTSHVVPLHVHLAGGGAWPLEGQGTQGDKESEVVLAKPKRLAASY